MLDINLVLANNILDLLKKQGKKQIDLADSVGVSKQTMSKMLNGGRVINAAELHKIADFLSVPMDVLVKIPEHYAEYSGIRAFMGRVESPEARKALEVADKMSDMILFHKKVRENGMKMMNPWEEE